MILLSLLDALKSAFKSTVGWLLISAFFILIAWRVAGFSLKLPLESLLGGLLAVFAVFFLITLLNWRRKK